MSRADHHHTPRWRRHLRAWWRGTPTNQILGAAAVLVVVLALVAALVVFEMR